MPTPKTFFVSLIFAAFCLAALPALAGGDAAEAVRKLNQEWDNAFNAKDAAKVASLYAENGRVVTGDGNVLNGREEIQGLFQSFMDSGFHDHAIEMIDVRGDGSLVYETGKWSGVGADGKTYGGHILNIYEATPDGDWQTVLHMWN